ncbi:hypothetical protein SCE1572_48625 [Sorangium cellulosum So0157-2]|uniref:eCIS core domain-containing protein n=1 Tax=Sorangium cellulosum So0157-2 TaxID=1254432 RepID=S4YBH1_SORCE|nr:hypothetical protein SCE1572_48625 [Sorangium cellulosum So0157-2]
MKSALAGVVETERDQRMHMSLADRAIGAVRTKPAAYSGYSDLVAAAQAAAPHRPAAPGRPAPIQAKAEGGPIFLKGLASSSSDGPSSVSGADGTRAIGRPSDPAEIEADRIADAAMSRSQGAGGCAACSQGAPGTTSPTPPAPSGQPLDPALQSFASDKLGGDFSDVRIHADAEAASAARALHARAYTVGKDVMFGEGQYSTGTASGLRLLLHELVHTKQDPSGQMLHRQDDGGVPPVDQGTSGSESADGTPPAAEFDPCSVNVASLTNAQLLARFTEADAYVRDPEHYRRDNFYKYLSLRRRTGAERERRARGGECWLADDITSVPATLYRLDPGPQGGALIRAEDGSAGAGPPRTFTDVSIVTDGQLQRYLTRNHVAPGTIEEVMRDPHTPHMVDISTAQAVWALQQLQQSDGISPMLSPNFAPGLGGALGTFTGPRPAGPGATLLDQLAYSRLINSGAGGGLSADWLASRGWPGIPGNNPAFLEAFTGPDLRSPSATLGQRQGSTGIASEGVFLPSPEVIAAFQAQGGIFVPENLPGDLPVSRLDEIMSRYPLPVGRVGSAMDAANAQQLSRLPPQEMMPVAARIGANMRPPNRPVVTDLMPYALRNLRPGGTLNIVYREAIISSEVQTSVRNTWTDPATGRGYRFEYVTPITEVAAGSAAPLSPGLGAISDPQESVFHVVLRKVPVTGGAPASAAGETEAGLPSIQINALGAGVAPGLWATGTGAAGNVIGGLTTVGLQRAYAALRGQPYGGTLGGDLRNIALTTPPAAGMSFLQLRLQQMAAQRVAAGGAGSLPLYLSPGAGRIALPAVTAPLITMGSMGLSGHSYPWQEYAVQGTRATANALVASGATAGFFAIVGATAVTGAETGAAGGTLVEPGGGTVVGGVGGFLIGAIVGGVAYFISDLTIGSAVEDATRSLVGEPDGCP